MSLSNSIPELLSHISTHLPDQQVIGLEATEKCLRRYPGNAPLLSNKRYFQNRMDSRERVHITLSIPEMPGGYRL